MPDYCGSETWYKYEDCEAYVDLCFRCVGDKDKIHANSHAWSRQPSTEIKWTDS